MNRKWFCEDCEEAFSEFALEPYADEDGKEYLVCVCPNCGSTEIYQLKVCEMCGALFDSELTICNECVDKFIVDFGKEIEVRLEQAKTAKHNWKNITSSKKRLDIFIKDSFKEKNGE